MLSAFGSKTVSSVAVRVQPGDVVARDRCSAIGRERCEIAADKNLAVRLDDHDENRAVRVGVETVECRLRSHLRRCS